MPPGKGQAQAAGRSPRLRLTLAYGEGKGFPCCAGVASEETLPPREEQACLKAFGMVMDVTLPRGEGAGVSGPWPATRR